MQEVKVDVIGDIHGMHRTFRNLLDALGWRRQNGRWAHPERRHLIQVGDLVDRGPDSLGVVETMRELCDSGVASHVIGNHEYNALAWFVPLVPGDPSAGSVRSHNPGHLKQFSATLAQIEADPKRWDDLAAWIRRQPLAMEYAGMRFVHAAWIPTYVNLLPRSLESDDVIRLCGHGKKFAPAIDICLKGPEERSPMHVDDHGIRRRTRRIPWWESYPADAPIVCFGHHWFRGTPSPAPSSAHNTYCLDYSAGRGGDLVAWRYPEDYFVSVRNADVTPLS